MEEKAIFLAPKWKSQHLPPIDMLIVIGVQAHNSNIVHKLYNDVGVELWPNSLGIQGG